MELKRLDVSDTPEILTHLTEGITETVVQPQDFKFEDGILHFGDAPVEPDSRSRLFQLYGVPEDFLLSLPHELRNEVCKHALGVDPLTFFEENGALRNYHSDSVKDVYKVFGDGIGGRDLNKGRTASSPHGQFSEFFHQNGEDIATGITFDIIPARDKLTFALGSYIEVLICTNGMTRRQTSSRKLFEVGNNDILSDSIGESIDQAKILRDRYLGISSKEIGDPVAHTLAIQPGGSGRQIAREIAAGQLQASSHRDILDVFTNRANGALPRVRRNIQRMIGDRIHDGNCITCHRPVKI